MKLTERQRGGLWLGAIGLAEVLFYGLLPIDLGDKQIPSAEAWARGVAQPFVTAGCLLIILALLHARNFAWTRWPIILWCPITVSGGVLWTMSKGAMQFDAVEFTALGIPVFMIWIWATYRMSPAAPT